LNPLVVAQTLTAGLDAIKKELEIANNSLTTIKAQNKAIGEILLKLVEVEDEPPNDQEEKNNPGDNSPVSRID